jgi:hypothetical protein
MWHVAGSPHASATICLPTTSAPPRASKPTSSNSARKSGDEWVTEFELAKFELGEITSDGHGKLEKVDSKLGELGESLGASGRVCAWGGAEGIGGSSPGGELQSIPHVH